MNKDKTNRRKSIFLFGAVLIAVVTISSATAVPYTQSLPYQEYMEDVDQLKSTLIEIKESKQFSRLKRLAESYVTEEQHQIVKQTYLSSILNHTDMPPQYWDMIDVMAELCCTIIELMAVAFGHNIISIIAGLIVFNIIMFIPKVILALGWSCVVGACCFGDFCDGLNVDEWIYNYGYLGLLLAIICCLPISLICGAVGLPIASLVCWGCITADVYFEVLDRIPWDW